VEVTGFLIADHAEAVNGKLYLTGGGWDTLAVPELPAQHPHISLAVVLRIPWTATNQQHTFEIVLVDEDGTSLLPETVGGQFEAGRPPGMRSTDDQTAIFALSINGLELKRDGTHIFRLLLDGSPEAEARFKVLLVGAQTVTTS